MQTVDDALITCETLVTQARVSACHSAQDSLKVFPSCHKRSQSKPEASAQHGMQCHYGMHLGCAKNFIDGRSCTSPSQCLLTPFFWQLPWLASTSQSVAQLNQQLALVHPKVIFASRVMWRRWVTGRELFRCQLWAQPWINHQRTQSDSATHNTETRNAKGVLASLKCACLFILCRKSVWPSQHG